MSRIIILGLTLLLGVSFLGHKAPVVAGTPSKTGQTKTQVQPVMEKETDTVRKLVENFGKKLQTVSLSATPEIAAKSMQTNYAGFLSPALLQKWQSNPQTALGRRVSSPWPDRIDIVMMQKTAVSAYKISGVVVEITSVEKNNGGVAAKQPVTLIVKKINNRWLIDEVDAGSYEVQQNVVYNNTQYGFKFSLPKGWEDYSVITGKWEGNAIGGAETVESGPMISIRHPKWMAQNPRQDIPVMIFTLSQWDKLQQEKFHIGAAPIGPSELGRNSEYVFALPARYNYAFPTGYEEVEQILQNKPLQPFEPAANGASE